MLYEGHVKRGLLITQLENQTTAAIDKLKIVSWLPRPENFRKQVCVVSLCQGYDPNTNTTQPDGFVNPLVTVTSGIPTITPPPVIMPVLMDFAIAGTPVTVSELPMQAASTLLLVATADGETAVPDTEDEASALTITVTPSSTGVPLPLQGTPIFVQPGVLSIPLSASETTVAGDNPSLTINFSNFATGVVGTALSIPLSSATSSSSDSSTLNNAGGTTVNVDASAQTVAPLGNGQNVITPTFQFTPAQINMPAPAVMPETIL
jgi:hypothetical protein